MLGPRSAAAQPSDRSQEGSLADLVVGPAAVLLKFVFFGGQQRHPENIASRCLEAGLALTAVDVDGELMIPASVSRAFVELEKLKAFQAVILQHDRRALLRFVLRHPLFAIYVVRLLRRRRAWAPETATSEETRERDVSDLIDDVHKMMVDMSKLESFASHLDREHVRPQYLYASPWCRLTLPPVGVASEGALEEWIDVSAMVHRSGVVIISFNRLLTADRTTVSQVNLAASARNPFIVTSKLDQRVVDLAAAGTGLEAVGTVIEEDGRPLVVFDHSSDPAGLDDVFAVYRDAFLHVAADHPLSEAHAEHMMVPLVSLRGCPDSHHEAVGYLLARHYQTEDLDDLPTTPDPLIDRQSGTINADVFISAACIVHLFRDRFRKRTFGDRAVGLEEGVDWLYYEFSVALALETGLLRRRLLGVVRTSVENAQSARDFRMATRTMVTNYTEISGGRLFVAGEINQIEGSFLRLGDFEAEKTALLAEHEVAERLMVAEGNERAGRAATRVQLLIVVLTVAVGILGPLGILIQLEVNGTDVPQVAGHPYADWVPAVLIAVSAVLVVAVVALVATFLIRPVLRARRPRSDLVRLPADKAAGADRMRGGAIRWVAESDS